MHTSAPAQEGLVPFRGYRVWYRAVGEARRDFVVGEREAPGKLPLLCLHGGPGCPHDYLEPLEGMAETGRRVIFYDQLGCGNSDVPEDPSIYTLALYVEEVGVIRRALGLERVHLLGHSWGGMLALEYALTRPTGLASLILADTAASSQHWMAEGRRLAAELPPEVQETIRVHEAAGTTDSPDYQRASELFLARHVNRMHPRPDCVRRLEDKPGDDVYHLMWGPSEFCINGSLRDWDVTARLGEIRVPTLVIGGRFDHATPAITQALHRGIAGSRWVIFEHSGHLPHLEETESYLQVLDQFLSGVEALAPDLSWQSRTGVQVGSLHPAGQGGES